MMPKNTSQIMLKTLPRMRPAFTYGSLAYCRPEAWISCFALLPQIPGNGSKDRDKGAKNAEDQDQGSLRVLPRRRAVGLAVWHGRAGGLEAW